MHLYCVTKNAIICVMKNAKRKNMRENTYIKLGLVYQKHKGYISTRELLEEGFSNRQIGRLVEEKYLEKPCFGYYWMTQEEKPADYKCIEVCLSNPRAVICLDSACFYQGILKSEPEYLSVATCRTDRSSIRMKYKVDRHFFSEKYFQDGRKKVDTKYGSYNIFEVERSVCDMIRLNENIPIEISNKKDQDREFHNRIQKYAELLGVRVI